LGLISFLLTWAIPNLFNHPIDDFSDADVIISSEKPTINIREVDEIEFKNLGTTIEVLADGATSSAGYHFRLAQFYMHTPSEHHVNGGYHLEIRMVHQGLGTSHPALRSISPLL